MREHDGENCQIASNDEDNATMPTSISYSLCVIKFKPAIFLPTLADEDSLLPSLAYYTEYIIHMSQKKIQYMLGATFRENNTTIMHTKH